MAQARSNGDQVSFFLSPSEEAVRSMVKKKKHMLQFTGPREIVEVLSFNYTAFRILYQGRHDKRNAMHINKYRSLDQVSEDTEIALDPEVTVGSFFTVLDSSDDSRYHVVKVIDITDQNLM